MGNNNIEESGEAVNEELDQITICIFSLHY
jgi:hypothetical protein